MARPRFFTIQKKFLLLFLLVGLVPAVSGVLISVWGAQRSFSSGTAVSLEMQAREIADRIGLYCEERHEFLRALVERQKGNFPAIWLEPEVRNGTQAIVFYTPGENLLIGAVVPGMERFVDLLRENKPLFAQYHEERLVPPEGYFDDLSIKREGTPSEVNIFFFAYPNPEGGCIFFVSEGDEILRRVTMTIDEELMHLSVFARKGYSLTAPSGDRQIDAQLQTRFAGNIAAAPGWFNVRRWESDRLRWHLVAYSAVPRISKLAANTGAYSSPWVVVLSYDMENFLGPLVGFFWTAVVAALAWMAVLTAMAIFTTRRVVVPIKNLRHQAEVMADGNLKVRAEVHTRDEIEDLADAFNRMAQRLRENQRDLENRAEESRVRAEHINIINEITKAITQALDLDRTFEILERELPKLLDFDGLWIAIAGEVSGELVTTHTHPKALLASLRERAIPMESTFHGRSLTQVKAARGVVSPGDAADSTDSGVFTTLGYHSFLIAPLPSKGGALGTVTAVSKREDAYGEAEVEILASVASAVAVGIEQADLFTKTREFAEHLERKVQERTEELEKATEGLIQAEKYSATGRLAANLAHEINNPLGIIKNYVTMTTQTLMQAGGGRRETDPNLENLRIIDQEINRIAGFVRQLLDMHRPPDQNPQPTDIEELLRDVLVFMEKDFETRGIQVSSDYASDLPQPLVAADLLRQVFINVIRNAEDAMEGGGTLTVRVTRTRLGRGEAAREGVAVTIHDTGVGISKETMRQIFDPFFTTKSEEKGTGLGLYVSYGIVQRYQGTFDVESQAGEGTTVRIALPTLPTEPGNPGAASSEIGLANKA